MGRIWSPIMKKCNQYSAEFKEKMLAKALAPNAPSIIELSRRAGIPSATLHTWVHMNKKSNLASKDNTRVSMRPKDLSAEAKLQAVFDTLEASEENRSAYCRKHGFYIHDLDKWKSQLLSKLEPKVIKKDKAEYRQVIAENKALKRELTRKEKALAETSALLVLKKKANLLWGDKEED